MSASLATPPPNGNDFPVPRSIRDVLLPEEAGGFDREYRAAMAQATESLDLTGVLQVLERWRRVAESSRDAQAHQRMLRNAGLLGRAGTADEITTEAWSVTRSRLVL
jgi:Family of unknown function (DUF6247)